jgi:hypothetical protein
LCFAGYVSDWARELGPGKELTDWDGRVRERKDVFGPDEVLVISTWEDDEIAHRQFGHGVVLNGRRVVRLQNSAQPLLLRFSDFYAKEYGEWHLAASHWSSITKSVANAPVVSDSSNVTQIRRPRSLTARAPPDFQSRH